MKKKIVTLKTPDIIFKIIENEGIILTSKHKEKIIFELREVRQNAKEIYGEKLYPIPLRVFYVNKNELKKDLREIWKWEKKVKTFEPTGIFIQFRTPLLDDEKTMSGDAKLKEILKDKSLKEIPQDQFPMDDIMARIELMITGSQGLYVSYNAEEILGTWFDVRRMAELVERKERFKNIDIEDYITEIYEIPENEKTRYFN